MDKILPTLITYAFHLPEYLVWLTGLALSAVFWRRHPRVSLFALIAILGFIVTSAVVTYLNLWLPIDLHENGWSSAGIGTALGIVSVVDSLVSAILWGLLIAAVFGWRPRTDEPAQKPPLAGGQAAGVS